MHGLIKTNENCVGCNKCIRSCNCFGAQVATTLEDGRNIVKVNKDKCILCAKCFTTCEHNAREYFDDTDAFFDALENGEKITLLVAPSFFANYAKDYKKILGLLKIMGVSEIISVGFGADISTWGYIKLIQEHGFVSGISQPCPVVVDYIEKYEPKLLSKLMPIQSPLMCTAIYARKELCRTERFAFLGPCIAKRDEINSLRGKEEISFNITYQNFFKRIKKSDYENIENEVSVMFGIGSMYPMVGGLDTTIKWFLGNSRYIRHIEGQSFLYKYFRENSESICNDEIPFLLIDALNCSQGCIYGTAIENEVTDREQSVVEIMKIKQNVVESVRPWSRDESHEKRLRELNEHFENLDLDDYICEYTDKSEDIKHYIPSDEEIEKIFISMNKKSEKSRKIDCACCGHENCKSMAIAIYNEFNYKENCIYYIRETVENEKIKALESEIFKELALKDVHTGLLNRNAFYQWLNNEKQFKNKGIIISDLNDLKKCNDTFGHDFGDEYIKSAGNILTQVFDAQNVYRIGGDEFAIIVDDVDEIDVNSKIEHISVLVERYDSSSAKVKMAMALGFAVYDNKIDRNFTDTQKRADFEMYKNKKIIKNII